MKIFHTDRFGFPLPAEHRFPETKYRLLREAVERTAIVSRCDLLEPEAATPEELCSAHTPGWVDAVRTGQLDAAAWRRVGLPWSPPFVERCLRSVGGTLAAARTALREGLGIHLAGGTHHAFADRGEGFCVFNDVAVAIQALRREGRIRRALIVDLDVHQGNGTAAMFAGDPGVFTLSLHGARNFPLRKERSTLDVALPDGTEDESYLRALELTLDQAFARGVMDGPPEIAFYVAGSDPWVHDRLGRLALSAEGLAARDRRVLRRCARAGLPVVLTMAGGYARDPFDTVRLHVQTIELALEML